MVISRDELEGALVSHLARFGDNAPSFGGEAYQPDAIGWSMAQRRRK